MIVRTLRPVPRPTRAPHRKAALALAVAMGLAVGPETDTELSEAGTATYLVEWMAPDTGESVAVHAAANATNDDGSEFGDYVYSASAITEPAS